MRIFHLLLLLSILFQSSDLLAQQVHISVPLDVTRTQSIGGNGWLETFRATTQTIQSDAILDVTMEIKKVGTPDNEYRLIGYDFLLPGNYNNYTIQRDLWNADAVYAWQSAVDVRVRYHWWTNSGIQQYASRYRLNIVVPGQGNPFPPPPFEEPTPLLDTHLP